MGLFRIGHQEIVQDIEHENRIRDLEELHKEILKFNSKVANMSEKELLEQICRELFLIRAKLDTF